MSIFRDLDINSINKIDMDNPMLLWELSISPLPNLENISQKELIELLKKESVRLQLAQSRQCKIMNQIINMQNDESKSQSQFVPPVPISKTIQNNSPVLSPRKIMPTTGDEIIELFTDYPCHRVAFEQIQMIRSKRYSDVTKSVG